MISYKESNYFITNLEKLKILRKYSPEFYLIQISEIIYSQHTLRSFKPSIHLDILGTPACLA